jgi:hypothetical protein
VRIILSLILLLISIPAFADPQSAVQAVRSIPGVDNAFEDTGGNLFVLVRQNPSAQWNNVAVEICKIVRPHQARIFLVKMVDEATVAPKSKPKDWGLLGAASCGMIP